MIQIKCESQYKMRLQDMEPFQGNLKQRTKQDLEELKESLKREGLLMPFAVWKHDDKNYLLDGHGRRQVLIGMAEGDANILSYDFPIIPVEAETEDDARKALLQITSSYGKVTRQGVKAFTVSIPNYVAPSIKKYVPKVKEQVKAKSVSTKTIIRVQVDKDKAADILNILKQFDFIKVL